MRPEEYVETSLKEVIRMHIDGDLADSLFKEASQGVALDPVTLPRINYLIDRIVDVYAIRHGEINTTFVREMRTDFYNYTTGILI